MKSPIKFWGLVVFILHKIEIESERVCKWYVSPLWRGFPSVSPSFFVVSTHGIFSGKPSLRYVDFRCFWCSERPGEVNTRQLKKFGRNWASYSTQGSTKPTFFVKLFFQKNWQNRYCPSTILMGKERDKTTLYR